MHTLEVSGIVSQIKSKHTTTPRAAGISHFLKMGLALASTKYKAAMDSIKTVRGNP